MADESRPAGGDRSLGRPRAMTEAARRQQIVDAAACAFSHKGYWATTMDEVARQAGMSKKTLYQLFSSKGDIVDLLLRDVTEPFARPFDTAGCPRAALTQGLIRLATAALDEKHVEITRVLIAEAARPGDVADAIERQGICRGDWALRQWLAAQPTLGGRAVDDPGELAATIFWAAIGESLIGMLLRVRPRPDDAEIADRIDRVVTLFFPDP